MAIFMTKVWGFEEPAGPLQFGKEGWRDRAREELKAGEQPHFRLKLDGLLISD